MATAFDADALIDMFANASARQGEQLRTAVRSATLAALQGRELTLKNMRKALGSVAEAAGAGVAKNALPQADAQKLLDTAVAGMDEALLRAVDANRVALQQLAERGADMRDQHLKKALSDLERMEDMLFETVKKAAAGMDSGNAPWAGVLEKLQAGGTRTGMQAASTVEELTSQMQQGMRASRAAGMKAAMAMAESYSALVSGVLIGMSEALQGGGAKKAAPEEEPQAAAPAPAAKRAKKS